MCSNEGMIDNIEFRMIDPFTYRRELMDLYQKALKGDINEEQFIWKYGNNPQGKMLVWSAWDTNNSMLIGALSAFKRKFIYQQKLVTSFHLADGMVDEEYRGKRIFRSLFDSMVEHLSDEGSLFLMGYPNDLAAPKYRKYELCRELFLSHVYIYFIGCNNIFTSVFNRKVKCLKYFIQFCTLTVRSFNLIFKKYAGSNIIMEPVKSFGTLPEQWAFEQSKNYLFFPCRDNEFLQWKTIDVPNRIKKDLFVFWFIKNSDKIGYIVLYRDKKRNLLKIIDILCADQPDNLKECLAAVRCYAISKQFDAITTNQSSELLDKALRSLGFFKCKSVRAIVYIYDKNILRNIKLDGQFWYQLPIDRDNFMY